MCCTILWIFGTVCNKKHPKGCFADGRSAYDHSPVPHSIHPTPITARSTNTKTPRRTISNRFAPNPYQKKPCPDLSLYQSPVSSKTVKISKILHLQTARSVKNLLNTSKIPASPTPTIRLETHAKNRHFTIPHNVTINRFPSIVWIVKTKTSRVDYFQ